MIDDAERVHDIEREQRNMRSLEHVAAGVEDEIRRRTGPRSIVGFLPQTREQLVVELHARDVGDVAGDLAEAFHAPAAALRRLILAACHGEARHPEQEARIDPVIAGLMHSPPERSVRSAQLRDAAAAPSPGGTANSALPRGAHSRRRDL
jgi:hypothetical protein